VPSDVTLLVVPAALPELADVIATARCPLVVVPEPDHDAPDGTGERVVLLVGPAPGRPTVEAAFRAAARRGARLLAVRVCHQPSVELGGWLPPTRLAQWDAVAEQLRRELDSALPRCRMDFPRLAVTAMVVDDDPLQFLEALSHRAALIVLGHPTNGRARSTDFSTSVLARHARCPVMVVPVGA
jgi:nucleotide-binding universal stress UspA family protein